MRECVHGILLRATSHARQTTNGDPCNTIGDPRKRTEIISTDVGLPMSNISPRYSKEEHARRGADLYERQVRPRVEDGNRGRIVAIDIETGAFEVADETLAASRRLRARCPDAQIWCVRIGYPAVHRFGPRVRTVRS